VASVLDRVRRVPRFPPRSSRWWWLAAGAAALVVAAVMVRPLLGGPSFVRKITISNSSEFDVTVAVSSDHEQERMPLATVSHRSSVEVEDVIDQGSVWIFHFSADGREGGEVQIGRDELKRDGWRVEIPASVATRLRAEGALPPPF
jgi:hypothetical protein